MRVIKQYFGSGRCILWRKCYSRPYLNLPAIGVIYFESEIYRLNEKKSEECKMPNCISSEHSWDKGIYTAYGCAVDRGGVSGGGGSSSSSRGCCCCSITFNHGITPVFNITVQAVTTKDISKHRTNVNLNASSNVPRTRSNHNINI